GRPPAECTRRNPRVGDRQREEADDDENQTEPGDAAPPVSPAPSGDRGLPGRAGCAELEVGHAHRWILVGAAISPLVRRYSGIGTAPLSAPPLSHQPCRHVHTHLHSTPLPSP